MAKKSASQDDTGTTLSAPVEPIITDAVSTEPVAAPEATEVEAIRTPIPARKIVAGRLNRVTLTEARALRR